MIRVAIVEDDPRYRDSLETFFSVSEGFELAASFGSAESLTSALRRNDAPGWDLVLMDIELPGESGIEATRAIKRRLPELKVVMLTVFEDPQAIVEGISAGADGYLLKKASSRELLTSITAIVSGGSSLTPAVARHLLDWVRDNSATEKKDRAPQRLELTEREQEVLRCLVDGASYAKAAERLGISRETVKSHVHSIYRKLQVRSAAEAVSRALRDRLV